MIVNGFLLSKKFHEIYELLKEAADIYNIHITVKSNGDILADTFSTYNISQYDCCLFWDKDIMLAKYLESNGLRLFNCADAIEMCDDKALTHLELSKHNIKMPKTIIAPMTYPLIGYTDIEFLDNVAESLGFPIVIKERFGSFGAQVYIANNMDELISKVKEKESTKLIFQEYIAYSAGRDIRINMVSDRFCAAMERYNENDFRANVSNGGHMRIYEPTREDLSVAAKIMQILTLDYAGIDLLFSEDGVPYVCEVNSNAHFKNIYDLTGINAALSLMEYIKKEIGK